MRFAPPHQVPRYQRLKLAKPIDFAKVTRIDRLMPVYKSVPDLNIDSQLWGSWINNCMADEVGRILSGKLKYGNTTNQAANEENGLTYADKLFFAQQAEDQEGRTKIWNEIKAA